MLNKSNIFTDSCRYRGLSRDFTTFDFAPFKFCFNFFIFRFNMMAKRQILNAVFMTTIHFLKTENDIFRKFIVVMNTAFKI